MLITQRIIKANVLKMPLLLVPATILPSANWEHFNKTMEEVIRGFGFLLCFLVCSVLDKCEEQLIMLELIVSYDNACL